MPDGFSVRISFGETGEAFSFSSKRGDAADFREAYEAVRAAAVGRNEAEIRQLLADELRSRNVGTLPDMIGVLAAGIAADGDISVGGWAEVDLPDERPGLVGSLIGKVIGRVLARRIGEGEVREMMREAVAMSPVLSRLAHPDPPDPDLYVPEAGREPAPAEVITDPDLAERMPWLVGATVRAAAWDTAICYAHIPIRRPAGGGRRHGHRPCFLRPHRKTERGGRRRLPAPHTIRPSAG